MCLWQRVTPLFFNYQVRINDASPMVLIIIASLKHPSTHPCLSSFSLFESWLHLLPHCNPIPILNPVHKSQPCLGLEGSVTIHRFKSFLKHATSSQRPCSYPLLQVFLLSIVICSASIHTSVYCLFTPSSPILSYLPSHLLQHNEEHGTSTTMHATRFRDQIKCFDIHYWTVKSLCL